MIGKEYFEEFKEFITDVKDNPSFQVIAVFIVTLLAFLIYKAGIFVVLTAIVVVTVFFYLIGVHLTNRWNLFKKYRKK